MRLLLTIVISTVIFSSCQKLNEQEIPINGDCNSKDFKIAFKHFTDSLTQSDTRVSGIHLVIMNDTINCICHVKYIGNDSSEIIQVFDNGGWLKVIEFDTIASDTLVSDSISIKNDALNEMEEAVVPVVTPNEDVIDIEEDTTFIEIENDTISIDSTNF